MSCSHVAKYKEWCEDRGVDSNHVFADSSEANFESNLVPDLPSEECEHGHDRDPVAQQWTQHVGVCIYTRYANITYYPAPDGQRLPRVVYYRPTVGECVCRHQYDGAADLLHNIDNSPAAMEDLPVVTGWRHSERVFIDCAKSRRLLLRYSGKVSSGKSSGKSDISEAEMKDLQDKLDQCGRSDVTILMKRYGAQVDLSGTKGAGMYGTVEVTITSLSVLMKIFSGTRSDGRNFLLKMHFDMFLLYVYVSRDT
ncbi:Hypp8286 [Branchiostoma lanceolatum]|uniref:Hypp8286 protein n=1 Tax=Branchiostoma lanceolatum TaxID=7740 RepID=A0A8J9Z860_BRALA|nr:Hypp8286 [Branchiostoma lanceolatum]